MGILNVTPDSFSDGGRAFALDAALARTEAMIAEGADIIDVGGESTRPGSAAVTLDEERRRVLPVIHAIASRFEIPLSVDTTKPELMCEAAEAGAGLLNDVRALRAEGAIEAAAATGLPICLMHMQGEPRTMQQSPSYTDVVTEVRDFFVERIAACTAAGIARARLILDPGFGFGKALSHNCQLLAKLSDFESLGLPLLVGLSRKSMLGALTGRDVDARLPASLAAALIAAERGARIIRVHDVAATRDALRVREAVVAATRSQPAR